MSVPPEPCRLNPTLRPPSTLPLSKSMLTACPSASAVKPRVTISSPLPPPYIPSALPLGLLMSLAELKSVQAGSPKLSPVDVERNVPPPPVADHALPQPPLFCFAHEYDSPGPEAPTENIAVVPLQFVVLAGCDEMVGATPSITVTLDCDEHPTESVTVTV